MSEMPMNRDDGGGSDRALDALSDVQSELAKQWSLRFASVVPLCPPSPPVLSMSLGVDVGKPTSIHTWRAGNPRR